MHRPGHASCGVLAALRPLSRVGPRAKMTESGKFVVKASDNGERGRHWAVDPRMNVTGTESVISANYRLKNKHFDP